MKMEDFILLKLENVDSSQNLIVLSSKNGVKNKLLRKHWKKMSPNVPIYIDFVEKGSIKFAINSKNH